MLFRSNLNAQVISPLVQNSAGKSNEQNGTTLIYSVCELTSINNFISFNKSMLNTGFLNTYKIEKADNKDSKFIITSNPIINLLKIKNTIQKDGVLKIQLFDILGNQLYNGEFKIIQSNYEQVINIENYASGVYILKIYFSSNNGLNQLETFKIIKL